MADRQRRYEVFISSTTEDLQHIRRRLIQTTVRLGHIPSAMEVFRGTGELTVDHIEDCIRSADIFVTLVGARYGSEVPDKGESYTRFEYECAIKHRKPILAYLLKDEEVAKYRQSLPFGDPERQHEQDLQDFREYVAKDWMVWYFTSEAPDELAAIYATDLHEAIDRFEGSGGFVRGEKYDDLLLRAILGRRAARNPFFARFVARLNTFSVLTDRVLSQAPELKRAIADYFLERYLGRMIRADVRALFFESGSSIAFLSQAFIEYLQRAWMGAIIHELQIETNNILTHLDFVLSPEDIRTELYPYGGVDEKYGATLGTLKRIPPLTPPTHLRPLDGDVREAVGELREHLIDRYRDKGVIFMAASGLETSEESQFPGPHVGSYHNKLFKRALLESAAPTVLFLDERKVLHQSPKACFRLHECFPVCDDDLTWSHVCRANPLAIAIAASTQENADEIESTMCELGLGKVERNHDGNQRHYTLIASNDSFQEKWPGPDG